MNYIAVQKKVLRRVCEWNEEEKCFVHTHDEYVVVPQLRRTEVDPNLILDVEGEDITLTNDSKNQLTNGE